MASLSLGNLPVNDPAYVRKVVRTVVRALDNVIDLNFYPVPYAKITNHTYRSIGLGVSGYHHMLAKNKIKWQSEEHLAFVDKLFEQINYAAIEASSDYAKEKGSYRYFEGSDWESGAYFEKRGYVLDQWKELREKVTEQGMRNAYLLAIAPTSSTFHYRGNDSGDRSGYEQVFPGREKGIYASESCA